MRSGQSSRNASYSGQAIDGKKARTCYSATPLCLGRSLQTLGRRSELKLLKALQQGHRTGSELGQERPLSLVGCWHSYKGFDIDIAAASLKCNPETVTEMSGSRCKNPLIVVDRAIAAVFARKA